MKRMIDRLRHLGTHIHDVEEVDLSKGYVNLQFQIWKTHFFFLTWRGESGRRFFCGIIHNKNEELAHFCFEC